MYTKPQYGITVSYNKILQTFLFGEQYHCLNGKHLLAKKDLHFVKRVLYDTLRAQTNPLFFQKEMKPKFETGIRIQFRLIQNYGSF